MKTLLLLSLTLISTFTFSQSMSDIKADSKTYIWGEGKGMTLNKADKSALSALISQISTHVESSSSLEKNEQSDMYSEDFKSVVNTYSKATLNNTERMVITNEPDAYVFRYIKRSEIKKVFEQRKNKILEFVSSACKAQKNLQIADALRYYYWSIVLLKSHPYRGEIYYTNDMNEKNLLITWLPSAINNVFADVSFSVSNIEEEENVKTVILDITYKNQPVSNFDYTFWDGKNWSNITSAKDGKGFMEFYGASADAKNVKIKAEYIFEGEARIDRELEDVMGKIEHIPFRKSYFTTSLIKGNSTQKITDTSKAKETTNVSKVVSTPEKETLKFLAEVKSPETSKALLNKIFKAIETKQYASVKELFTDNGYDAYTKLLSYGNARIIDKSNLQFIEFNNEILARSVPMSFSFKNNKKFVENVCFTINKGKKISNITFALTDRAANDILSKKEWSEKVRFTLIYFLENYKSAYALKRLDYIESIFDDNALIIVGHEIKVTQTAENRYKNNKIVKYNKYSKGEYLKKLKYSFGSKEFINLKFEESDVRPSGKSNTTFGVQIKQNYFSSNYGDVGYLFLLVDLTAPDKPIIHIRTWQPNKEPDGSVYGIGDF